MIGSSSIMPWDIDGAFGCLKPQVTRLRRPLSAAGRPALGSRLDGAGRRLIGPGDQGQSRGHRRGLAGRHSHRRAALSAVASLVGSKAVAQM